MMGQLIELILRLLALLGGTITSGAEPTMIIPDPAPAPVVVEEDDPEWDCRTSGNYICGPLIDMGNGTFVDDNGWVFQWGLDGTTPIGVRCVFAAPCESGPVRPGCRTDLECFEATGLTPGEEGSQ
jgi:hypothetical protein